MSSYSPHALQLPAVLSSPLRIPPPYQVFVNLNMRHLFVVDAHNNVVGLITRKDLDHAAGHGWWRQSHQAEPPKNKTVLSLMSKIPSVSFLRNLVGSSSDRLTAGATATVNASAVAGGGHGGGGPLTSRE